jgi:hypothetical protein
VATLFGIAISGSTAGYGCQKGAAQLALAFKDLRCIKTALASNCFNVALVQKPEPECRGKKCCGLPKPRREKIAAFTSRMFSSETGSVGEP